MPDQTEPSVAHAGSGQREIRALTGIRGVAACWVVAYHLHQLDAHLYVPRRILLHGYLAVDVFFVLSGFVMTLSYEHLFASGTTARAYAAFLLRRVARVYPLYIVILLITLIGVLGVFSRHHLASTTDLGRTVILNAVMLQAWGFGVSLNGPSWSISTELAAYLVFPILLRVIVRSRIQVRYVALVCVGLVALVAVQPTPPTVTFPRRGPLDVWWGSTLWPMLRCVAEFSLGLLAYRVAEERHPILSSEGVLWAVSLLVVALLLVPGTDVLFVCLIPPLLVGLLVRGHPVSRVLSSRPVFALGRWSYAIYLWHTLLTGVSYRTEALVGRVAPRLIASLAAELAFWAVLLGLAALSFRVVERPGRALIRRLEARLFPREDRRIAASERFGGEVAQDG